MPYGKSLRIAFVTETYPPEINGVSLSVSHFVGGLRARGHTIQLVRPRQDCDGNRAGRCAPEDVLVRGLPLPRYPGLKFGLPAQASLLELWSRQPPDLVHIVTEGPLGWSALKAAKKLKLPVTSDFRTNFHAYSRHYGVGWLRRAVLGYLRRFHNDTLVTMVPTWQQRLALANLGFESLEVVARGVASDGTKPAGTAYLVSAWDRSRGVRAGSYPLVEKMLKGRLQVRTLGQESLKDAKDVLFYFIGRQWVESLETLHFLPGAIADHLTSGGGMLSIDSGQMSAVRWLEAGATGSYGTVVEPCNIAQKFPHPAIAIAYYLQGETLIEAYWKSVQMPGQGIFIGEPLAAPFRRK